MNLTKTTKILLIASSLWYFGEGLFGPLLPVYAERVGGDILDITWAWSIYLIVAGTLYIVFGQRLRNSKNKEKVMIFGYILNTIFTFSYILVQNTTGLFIVQIGIGVSEALSTPAWESLFAKTLEDPEDSFLWGLASGHTHLVTGIAVAIGGLIAHYVSFDALFIIMGVIQIAATIVQARILYIQKKIGVEKNDEES